MSTTRALAEFVYAGTTSADTRTAALRSRIDTACATAVGAPVGGGSAAWTNAVRASASGVDDVAVWGSCGAVLWPALHAVAGPEPDEERLAEAFGVGMAAGEAVWRTGGYREADRGFDGTSVFGTMAATAACARYLGLTVDEIVSALGVAASGTGGLLINQGSDLAAVHAGMAATTAVRAVRLAGAGFLAAPDILEARQGFGEAYFGPDTLPEDRLSVELTLGRGVRLRRYPCHPESQALVAAVAAARGAGTVEVTGLAPTSGAVRFDVPASAAQAMVSLRYVLAATLVHGTVSHAALDPASAGGQAAVRAMDRVRVEVVSRWDERLVTGAEPGLLVDGVPVPVWEPDSSADALREKWRRIHGELIAAGAHEVAARIADLTTVA